MSETGAAINKYDLEFFSQMIGSRLDCHGVDIRDTRHDMNEMRKEFMLANKETQQEFKDMIDEQKQTNALLIKQIEEAKEKCTERHNDSKVKIAGIAGLISGMGHAVTFFIKAKFFGNGHA